VDPFFDKDNQHSPNMTSGGVYVHLDGKKKLFLLSNQNSLKSAWAQSKYTRSIREKHMTRKRKNIKKIMKARKMKAIKGNLSGAGY
jgi:hypothetical protein